MSVARHVHSILGIVLFPILGIKKNRVIIISLCYKMHTTWMNIVNLFPFNFDFDLFTICMCLWNCAQFFDFTTFLIILYIYLLLLLFWQNSAFHSPVNTVFGVENFIENSSFFFLCS